MEVKGRQVCEWVEETAGQVDVEVRGAGGAGADGKDRGHLVETGGGL